MWAQNPEQFRKPNPNELISARLEGWIYAPQEITFASLRLCAIALNPLTSAGCHAPRRRLSYARDTHHRERKAAW